MHLCPSSDLQSLEETPDSAQWRRDLPAVRCIKAGEVTFEKNDVTFSSSHSAKAVVWLSICIVWRSTWACNLPIAAGAGRA